MRPLSQFLKLHTRRNAWNIPVRNFGCVAEDRIYRGAAPDEKGYQALRQFGIETVVNLLDSEQRDAGLAARRNGLRWYHLALSDREVPPASYIDRWLTWSREAPLRPIFVHCDSGRYRTGAMVAAYRILVDGWSVERAYSEALDFGFDAMDGRDVWDVYIRSLTPPS